MFALLALLFSGSSFAAPLGLSDVVKQGLPVQPQYVRAKAAVREAEENSSKAFSSLFPTLNGKADFTHKSQPTSVSGYSVPVNTFSNTDTYTVGLDLKQPLYTSGALTAGIRYYETLEAKSRQELLETKQSAVRSLVSTYFSFSDALDRLKLSEEHSRILKTYVNITKRQEKIGRSRKVDRLQADVNYALSLSDLEQAQKDLSYWRQTLQELLALSGDTSVEFSGEVPLFDIEPLPAHKAFQLALAGNPGIKKAESDLQNIENSKDLDVSQDLPRLDLGGSAGYISLDRSNLFSEASRYYAVGVTLTVPVFSGLSSFSKRQGYAELKVQREKLLETTRRDIRIQIEKALADLSGSRAKLKLAEQAVAAANEGIKVAHRDYERGLASSSDVVNIQRTRYEAERLKISSKISYLNAVLSLRELMGTDLEKVYAK